FNHAMRTYAFGKIVGERRGLRFDRELFYVAAVLHDPGLTDQAIASTRFELEGADAAKELLAREGMADADVDVVWEARHILDAWPRLGFKKEMLRYFERLYAKNPAGAMQSPVVADAIERRHGVRPPDRARRVR